MIVGHRLLPTSEAMLEGLGALQIYRDIESQVSIPRDLETA